MSSAVLSAAASLRRALVGFDPSLLSGTDCAALAEALAATEKACAGARLLAARARLAVVLTRAVALATGRPGLPARWVARQARPAKAWRPQPVWPVVPVPRALF